MNFIDRSVDIAKILFPSAYARKTKYQQFHFAFGYERNRLLGIGQNVYGSIHAKAIKFSKKFGVVENFRNEFLHAEIDLISRLWGKRYIDSRLKIVILRLNKYGQLCNSKPCPNCYEALDALDVTKVWYSTSDGKVVRI